MKEKMSLLVYDAKKRDFIEIDICDNIADIKKVQRAFEKDKCPWEVVILRDKNGNVILSFALDSFNCNSFSAVKSIENKAFLHHNKAILGNFIIQDMISFAEFVLFILQAIIVYPGEKYSLGKKNAYKNFKKLINQLYEYACMHTEEYRIIGEENSQSFVGHIYRRGLEPRLFLAPRWEAQRNKIRTKFAEKCQKLYENGVQEYLSGNVQIFAKLNFESALAEAKEGIVKDWLKNVIDISSENKVMLKEEALLYLNEKTLMPYWLWKISLMAREKYPKAKKGLDCAILDVEVYEEATKVKSCWLRLELEYFMSVCKLTYDEAMELHKSFTYDTYEGEVEDYEKLKELISQKVYYGYRNLLRRYTFMREYGQILYGTYHNYIDALNEKKIWK